MNELKIFENEELGKIRTVAVNDELWFVGKDICCVFGDKNHNRSLGRVDDADKREEEIIDSLGRKQKAIFVNESGLYSLLFAMQPQKANNDGESNAYPIEVQERIKKIHKFKRWVTHDVLPSIRKHGMYAVDELLNNPDLLISVAQELKTEREKNKALAEDNQRMKPKEIFADAVTTSKTSILIGELAKILKQNGYDTGEKRLFAWLRNNGYLIKRKGTDYNAPTQRSMGLGLFEVKETAVTHADGHVTVNKTTKVTGKGQQYFINKFLTEVAG